MKPKGVVNLLGKTILEDCHQLAITKFLKKLESAREGMRKILKDESIEPAYREDALKLHKEMIRFIKITKDNNSK